MLPMSVSVTEDQEQEAFLSSFASDLFVDTPVAMLVWRPVLQVPEEALVTPVPVLLVLQEAVS